MYTDRDFKTKKKLKEAVKNWLAWFKNPDKWEKDNAQNPVPPEPVTYFQPGGMFAAPTNGRFVVEGPQYPQPHKWYAQCIAENGHIVAVK